MISISIIDDSVRMAMERDGYSVIPSFLSHYQIIQLTEFYYRTLESSGVSEAFFTTHWSSSIDYRKIVNNYVQQELKENLDEHFSGYKCLLGYFLYKKPSTAGGVFMHKDWTLIDEKKFAGYTIWIPLVDTSEENGCFQVVQGSHIKDFRPRGSFIQQEYADVNESDFKALPVLAGDAIIFDHRLLHASPPNRSDSDRLSVGLIVVPENATVIHYYQAPEKDEPEVFEAGNDFLVKSFYDYQKKESPDYIMQIIKQREINKQ